MKRCLGALAFALCLAVSASAITVLSYNVENLFDDVHNGTEFREFDPSRGTWNREFFRVRVDSIAEVIRKVVPGGPDILLLQEVENENALRTLVDEGLKGMGYAWEILVPKQGLAANVAIVSRLPIVRVRAHGVGAWKGTTAMRDVIEAEIETGGRTLYVFDNHWKSKLNGVRSSEASRRESAGVLARRVREILTENPSADILAAGDLNENVDEYARTGRKYQTALITDTEKTPAAFSRETIFLSANARALGIVGERLVLYDPWFEIEASRRGSYSYQGDWLTVDHFLLSPGLFDVRGFSYRWGSFGPARLPLLISDRGVPKKFKALKGEKGYSDHLPLLITLDEKK